MKKLEDLFNIEIITPKEKELELTKKRIENNKEIVDMSNIIRNSLPKVSGLGEESDDDLDNLAQEALNTYQDLINLGMNVESKHSSKLFQVASNLLKCSIDAKNSKMDKKLKMIQLQIENEKLQSIRVKDELKKLEFEQKAKEFELANELKNLEQTRKKLESADDKIKEELMLQHKIEMDKEHLLLKHQELELKKQMVFLKNNSNVQPVNATNVEINGENNDPVVMDRNTLLQQLRNNLKKEE